MQISSSVVGIFWVSLSALSLSIFQSAAVFADSHPTISVVPLRTTDESGGEKIMVRGLRMMSTTSDQAAKAQSAAAQKIADRLLAAFIQKGALGLMLPLTQLPSGIADEESAEITLEQLQVVADRLTEFYRSNGYFIAKVFVPVQYIGDDKVVTLQVQEGIVGAVRVKAEPNLHYPIDLVTESAQSLIGKPVTEKTAQGAVSYAKDLPGISTSATFEPGANPGETDLVYIVKPGKKISGQVVADNFGSLSAGEYRLRGDISIVSPTGVGDTLSGSILDAFKPENTVLGSVNYRLPFGVPGGSFVIGYNKTQFKVNQGDFNAVQLNGSSNAYSAAVDYNFLRTRAADVSVIASYARKSTRVKVGTSAIIDDKINLATIELAGNNTDFRYKGINYFFLSLRAGNVKSVDEINSVASPQFGILSARYVRYQLLPRHQEMVLQISGQYSSQRLSSLEQFSVGGPESVRAYRVSEQLRDSGVFSSIEWRIYAPGFYEKSGPFGHVWGDLLQFSAFYDYASGEYSKNQTRNFGDSLSGVGLGLSFSLPSRFRFRLTAATPLTTDYDRSQALSNRVRYFGELSMSF